MVAWFERDPALLEAAKRQVAACRHPLFVVIDGARAIVRGAVVVTDPERAVEAARYAVEIALPDDHPHGVPTVRETEGRIPWTQDRHVNANGSACLFVTDERWRVFPAGSTLTQFIDGPVSDFFLWQAGVDLTGKPPFAARPHKEDGIREYYEELVGTRDPMVVLGLLVMLASATVDRRADCYCGRRLPLEECHLAELRSFRARTPRERATAVALTLKDRLLMDAQARATRGIDIGFAPPPGHVVRLVTRPPALDPPSDLVRLARQQARFDDQQSRHISRGHRPPRAAAAPRRR